MKKYNLQTHQVIYNYNHGLIDKLDGFSLGYITFVTYSDSFTRVFTVNVLDTAQIVI